MKECTSDEKTLKSIAVDILANVKLKCNDLLCKLYNKNESTSHLMECQALLKNCKIVKYSGDQWANLFEGMSNKLNASKVLNGINIPVILHSESEHWPGFRGKGDSGVPQL